MSSVTGSPSMRYNAFTQRGWLAESSSKREIAIEQLRDNLSTKYAELFWSNSAPVSVTLTRPSVLNTDDSPGTQASNVLVTVPVSSGYSKVFTPSSISTPVFELVDNLGTSAGLQAVKYAATHSQLCEITGELVLAVQDTTERNVVLSIYVNDALVHTQLRSVSIIDSAAGDDLGVPSVINFNTELSQGDVVKLVAWKVDDTAGSAAALSCYLAKLHVKTLP